MKFSSKLKFFVVLFSATFISLSNAEKIPLDHFIKHGDYLDLRLSPDGNHIAGTMREKGTVYLLILNTKTQEIVGGINPPKNTIVHSFRWANNERVVYEFAERFSQLDRPIATGELYGINIDSSKNKLLYGFRAGDKESGRRIHTKKDIRASQEIISLLEDDPKHILIAEYPWTTKSIPMISKLNIYTGRKTEIERVPYNRADILADDKGDVRFISWWDKNDDFHAASRENKDSEWQEMDLAEGTTSLGRPVQINKAKDKAYLKADTGDKELSSLLELDLKTGVSKTLFTQEDVDLSFWENDLETNEPVVGVSYPAAAKYQYVDTPSKMQSIHKLLVKAFKGQDIFITSHTKDGKKLLVRVSGDINPGEYYLFDTETKKADFLWANLSWIDPRQMSTMENIKLKARDGVDVHGLLTIPKNANAASPLIVLPHGGPHGIRDHWQFDQEVQLLASRGFAVLQVNFRGSGGYGQAFERDGYREWGGKMIDDIIDATKWTADRSDINADRICIYGASYGGYAAMMSAIKEPNLYKCVIGYVGVYDLNIMYSDGDIPDFWGGKAYLQRVLGNDKNVLAQNSPTNHADKLKAKVMLVHGVEDRRAPIKHAKLMRKAMKKAKKDVNWLSYDGAGHGVWDIDKRRDMYSKILGFLDKNIGIPQ